MDYYLSKLILRKLNLGFNFVLFSVGPIQAYLKLALAYIVIYHNTE